MYRLILTLTLISCLSQAQCLAVDSQDVSRIVGGVPTTIESHPYAVQVQQSNYLICGGSLVSTRCVLSAAHCFVDSNNPVPNPRAYTVRVGSATVNSGTSHSVSTIVVHPAYSTATQDSDLAILVLTSRVTLSARVMVAQLLPPGFSVPDNATVTAIGWGRTRPADPWSGSPVLNEVDVRKVAFEECAARYAALRLLLTRNMLCAGLLDAGGKDSCFGDSGGPLLFSNAIAGVVSWGHECALAQFPGVYVKATNYNSWINETLTRYNAAPSLRTRALMLILSIIFSLINK